MSYGCGYYTHNCERPIMCLHHYSYSLAVALDRNDCSSSPEDRCDFVCDCQDCSDEQDCGKTLNVYMFISSGIWWLYLCVLFLTFFLFSFIGWMLGYQGRDFVCDFEHEKCGWTVQSGEGGYVVAETAERKHAPWQRAVLWLHLWHFHRYMMIQLTFLQEFFIFIKHFQIQW